MNAALLHRGPDGEGAFAGDHVAMAMRRLSIIDLTTGSQPLYNEDKSCALVANGEIYNHVEVRRDLEGRGHRFKTRSDCEVVLHLYEEYALDCFTKMRGMFVVSLWDGRRLILARDRMGEKPLYLFLRGEGEGQQLLFASELKALLASGVVPFELDPERLNEYMHYDWVHDPRTILKGVRKLPRATMLVVDTINWSIEEKCYWRMEDAPPIDGDPATLLRSELERVSELVIRSDVPVGVALSGGLDSSVIAALAAAKYPGTLQAFSVGYKGRPRQDERSQAREFAEAINIPIREIEVGRDDLVRAFPTLCFDADDPIADIAAFGYSTVCKIAAEQGCPVLLMGQGADELFWGYPWARRAVLESDHKARFGTVRRPGALESLMPRGVGRSDLIEYAYRMAGMALGWRRYHPDESPPADQLVFYNLLDTFLLGDYANKHIFTKNFRREMGPSNAASPFTIEQPWGAVDIAVTKLLCDGYLLENGIAQGDRLSMAASVELRLPFVDYRLVETAIGLRKVQKDYVLEPKAWLKAAVRGLVPDMVLNRPKRGFNPPTGEWMSALRTAFTPKLTDGYLVGKGILDGQAARNIARSGSRFHPLTALFFRVLVLEFWAEKMSAVCT